MGGVLDMVRILSKQIPYWFLSLIVWPAGHEESTPEDSPCRKEQHHFALCGYTVGDLQKGYLATGGHFNMP